MHAIRTVFALFAICAALAGPPAAYAQDAKAQAAANLAAQKRLIATLNDAAAAGAKAAAACNYFAWTDAQKTYDVTDGLRAQYPTSGALLTRAAFPPYPYDECNKKQILENHPGTTYQAYVKGGPMAPSGGGGIAHAVTNCLSCQTALNNLNAHIDVYNALVASKAPASAIASAQAAMDGYTTLLTACEKACAASNPAPGGLPPKPSGGGVIGAVPMPAPTTGQPGTTGSGGGGSGGGGSGGVGAPAKGLPGSSSDPYVDVPKGFGEPKSPPSAPSAPKAPSPVPAPPTKAILAPPPAIPVSPTGVAPKPLSPLPAAPVVKPPVVEHLPVAPAKSPLAAPTTGAVSPFGTAPKPLSPVPAAPAAKAPVVQFPAKPGVPAPTSVVCPAGQKAVTIGSNTSCAPAALSVGH
jgi:hypothetical protein